MKVYKDGKLISLNEKEKGQRDIPCPDVSYYEEPCSDNSFSDVPYSEISRSDCKDQTTAMLEEIKKKALLRLSTLCVQGEHCNKDMREKMEKWGLPDEMQEEIIDVLTAEGFIDEERYCSSFIHDKMEYNKWGPKKIEQALRMKGISRETISLQLDSIEEVEWEKILRPLLEKKRETVKGRNDYDTTQRLLRFAAGRGFTIKLAMRCIEGGEEMVWQ